jgi:hypothetical protein
VRRAVPEQNEKDNSCTTHLTHTTKVSFPIIPPSSV